MTRIPEVKPLNEILPRGAEGGREFARIVDLLLFHDARRRNKSLSLFSDVSGDYHGMDSFSGHSFRKEETCGYQYKFFSSPLSAEHRADILSSLRKTLTKQNELKLKKWILVLPTDLTETSKKGGGDVSWFETIKQKYQDAIELEQWGHKQIISLFMHAPHLCLFYYPELVPRGNSRRKSIGHTRKDYDANLLKFYRDIQFVGMSVYKAEATKGIPIEHIYIPLSVVAESAPDESVRTMPTEYLSPGKKTVVLGDPGSGKSTLLRFLALVGISKPLQRRGKLKADKRLPIIVVLRGYADELKARPNLSLLDYIVETTQANFSLRDADLDFFEYFLESGQAILLFDGLDELPSPNYKEVVRDRISSLITTFPGNTTFITSRIVGYENPFRFDQTEFFHLRLTRLQLPEIEAFVTDWYRTRLENPREREANIKDLIRILSDESHAAIKELAQNPLLLTIVTLVHRIDAVLPDERVVLYQKCTETLLNTWHTWKYRQTDLKNKGKVERRNRKRMEAIAYWMHCRSLSTKKTQRAIVKYDELVGFLADHIKNLEKPDDEDANDLADQFIDFVRKKAGLIIEVGDQQFSFVHLTFQEYLTSSHIITNNESVGAAGLWRTIQPYWQDSRWQEVIRLLIAGLKSDDTQRLLIESIIASECGENIAARPQLLAGLLIDGIQPAEEHKGEILQELVHACCQLNDATVFNSIIGKLRYWGKKDASNGETILQAAESALARAGGSISLPIFLLKRALGLTSENDHRIPTNISPSTSQQINFLLNREANCASDLLQGSIKRFLDVNRVFSVTSPGLNFLSSLTVSCISPLGELKQAKALFLQQLTVIGHKGFGPFRDFMMNFLMVNRCTDADFHNWIISACRSSRVRHAGTIDGFIEQLAWLGLHNRNRSLRKKLLANVHETREDSPILDAIEERNLALTEDVSLMPINKVLFNSRKTKSKDAWRNILGSGVPDALCQSLVFCFELEPKSHWVEALKADLMPGLHDDGLDLRKPAIGKIERNFRKGTQAQIDVYKASCMLLIDAWACLVRRVSQKSPFQTIASLTQISPHPSIRIAHYVRNVTFPQFRGHLVKRLRPSLHTRLGSDSRELSAGASDCRTPRCIRRCPVLPRHESRSADGTRAHA